jgi:hypothetical protein
MHDNFQESKTKRRVPKKRAAGLLFNTLSTDAVTRTMFIKKIDLLIKALLANEELIWMYLAAKMKKYNPDAVVPPRPSERFAKEEVEMKDQGTDPIELGHLPSDDENNEDEVQTLESEDSDQGQLEY